MHIFYKKNGFILNSLVFKNKQGFIPKVLRKKKKNFLVAGDMVNVMYFHGNILRSFTGFVVFRRRLHVNPFLCIRNVYAKSIVEYSIHLDSTVLSSVDIIRRKIINTRGFSLKFLRQQPRRFSKFFRFGYL